MQYFRPAARHYELTGRYTDLRPNPNPNSEFGKWIREETRRCWEGYVRESDGEWIPGDLYFFWNYTPMSVSKRVKGKKKSQRVIGFPSIWEGHYLKAHYLEQARDNGKMAVELASRQKGKSFYGAAMLAKRFILGESKDVTERVVSYITATDKSKLSNGDQTLDKFQYDIDFIAQHMQWPARRLFNSLSDFNWQMGYKDLDSGTNRGTLNSVVGKSSQKDTASLIGSRGVLYLFEEAGYFSNLLGLWNNLLPSVMDNDDVYGMLYGYGTSGDDESDFSALQEIMYNPEGYKAYGVDNVYDKEGLGKKLFTYFFPGYLNLAGCYDEDGNSDVTKALLTILLDRYNVKYNSSDPATIAKKIAHIPITPQEAILRVKGSIFPTVDITERINQLDNDTRVYDSVYIGDLVFNGSGQVEFVPTDDTPIRDFPLKDNKAAGAIEIYSMPKKDSTGKVPAGRYIVGHDPVDDDESNTMSLTSTFVLDLFTDEIVWEWTGRLQYADDNFERLRKICLFYNAKCMYEQNKKGAFAYFSMMNCLYLLADTPEYLKDKMIIKEIGYGNRAHPYSEKVYTPEGIKSWGEIHIGDTLFSSYGTTIKVVGIPFNDVTDIYEVTLKDGRKVKASENHLWKVIDYNDLEKVLSTKQMLESGYLRKRGKYKESKYYIPKNDGVEFSKKELPLPPYFMGLMLGDGCFTRSLHHQANFTSSLNDLEEYKKFVPYECKTIDDRHHWWKVPNIGNILRELDLHDKKSHNKFIPDIYKYSDKEDRLALLQGLLDTDGSMSHDRAPEYVTTSKQLCKDVVEVARSLGINCSVQEHKNKYGTYNKIVFYSSICLFRLNRKAAQQRLTKKRFVKTGIVDIRYVGKELSKCVTVDSKDGCYLINEFVTTHNSKGITATQPVNKYADKLTQQWLLKKTVVMKEIDGKEVEVEIPQLYTLKNRAFLKECLLYSPDINVDRVRAFGMLMLYREEFMILYGGNVAAGHEAPSDYLGNDKFFTVNYDDKKKLYGEMPEYVKRAFGMQ